MSRSRTTAGKLQRQQQKQAKARTKLERREARHLVGPESAAAPSEVSESQLLEELAVLHRALESEQVSLQEFEDRRERIRIQLEQLS